MKLFNKIASIFLGASLTLGVGVIASRVGSDAKEAKAADSWVKTAITDLATNDVVVIVGNNGDDYAMSNNNGTGNPPSAVSVTIDGSSLSSTVADTIKWKVTVSVVDDVRNYQFLAGTSGSNYLYCTNANNGLRVGTNTNNTFTLTSNYLYNVGQGRYVGIYNSTDWRSYTSINNNISGQTFSFYKQGGVSKTSTSTTITAADNKTTLDVVDGPGDTVQLSASVTYSGGTISNPGITWSTNNNNIATVSSSGLVAAVGTGTATITARYAGDSSYESSSGEINIKVINSSDTIFVFSDIASANSWENATAYTTVVYNGVTITASGGGNNAKYYSSDYSWRMYDGGSLTITPPAGKIITAVVSTPSVDFSVAADGLSASASFSETTKFTSISVSLGNQKTIVSSRIVAGTVSANNETNKWNLDGFKFFVTYEGESETEVTNSTTFTVNPNTVPSFSQSGNTSVTVTGTFGTESKTTDTIQATLTYVDIYAISRLYNTAAGVYEGTFYGYYMYHTTRTISAGTRYDIFVGNGDYGMLVYGATTDPSSWTPHETAVSVSGGYLTIFHNLYELSSYVNSTNYAISMSVLNDTEKAKVAPVTTYHVDGTEDGNDVATQKKASRLAQVKGKITKLESYNSSSRTYSDIDEYSDSTDVRITLELANGKSATVYAKPNIGDNLKTAIVKNQTITVRGFTSIYDEGFQISYPELVETTADYKAVDFAKDLLSSTDAICEASDHDNGSALSSVWLTLETEKYAKIGDDAQITKLVEATADDELVIDAESTDEEIISAAMARYDHICKAYNFTNFIGRSTANRTSGSSHLLFENSAQFANSIILVIVGLVSVTAIGGYFYLKKKKENN